MLDEKVRSQYKQLFNTNRFKKEIKPITLELILGEEISGFYDKYFSDINLIITTMIEENRINYKVNFDTYCSYGRQLLLMFLKDDYGKNKTVLENFFNALSIVLNTDDINKIIENTILIVYNTYYLK